jgi:hypothetical protein
VYVAVKTKHLRSNSTKTMFVIIFFSDSNQSGYYPNTNMDSEALGCEYDLVVDRHFVRYRLCLLDVVCSCGSKQLVLFCGGLEPPYI